MATLPTGLDMVRMLWIVAVRPRIKCEHEFVNAIELF